MTDEFADAHSAVQRLEAKRCALAAHTSSVLDKLNSLFKKLFKIQQQADAAQALSKELAAHVAKEKELRTKANSFDHFSMSAREEEWCERFNELEQARKDATIMVHTLGDLVEKSASDVASCLSSLTELDNRLTTNSPFNAYQELQQQQAWNEAGESITRYMELRQDIESALSRSKKKLLPSLLTRTVQTKLDFETQTRSHILPRSLSDSVFHGVDEMIQQSGDNDEADVVKDTRQEIESERVYLSDTEDTNLTGSVESPSSAGKRPAISSQMTADRLQARYTSTETIDDNGSDDDLRLTALAQPTQSLVTTEILGHEPATDQETCGFTETSLLDRINTPSVEYTLANVSSTLPAVYPKTQSRPLMVQVNLEHLDEPPRGSGTKDDSSVSEYDPNDEDDCDAATKKRKGGKQPVSLTKKQRSDGTEVVRTGPFSALDTSIYSAKARPNEVVDLT